LRDSESCGGVGPPQTAGTVTRVQEDSEPARFLIQSFLHKFCPAEILSSPFGDGRTSSSPPFGFVSIDTLHNPPHQRPHRADAPPLLSLSCGRRAGARPLGCAVGSAAAAAAPPVAGWPRGRCSAGGGGRSNPPLPRPLMGMFVDTFETLETLRKSRTLKNNRPNMHPAQLLLTHLTPTQHFHVACKKPPPEMDPSRTPLE